MFIGVHHNRLDNKGRITLPAEFRKAADAMITADEAAVYVTLSAEKPCLVGFVHQSGSADQSRNLITEDNAPFCQKISTDNTGRFVLGNVFRQALASTTQTPDSVLIVGRKEFFEIWTPEDWKQEVLSLYKKRGLDITPGSTPEQSTPV